MSSILKTVAAGLATREARRAKWVAPAHPRSKALAIVGPTASGKTSLALELAREFGGEIVSADSRQLYRGTDICTDIPAGKWRRFVAGRRAYIVEGVPHYLLASESPAHPLTLVEYRRRALWRLKEIASRGKLPLLVGGTGLYVRAVVENFSVPQVAPNTKLRARLTKQSVAKLFAKLQQLDPDYAARIDPNNRRFITRALEVIAVTGKTFSSLQGRGESPFVWLELGVARPREELYTRINCRVDGMVAAGLLTETKRLARRYGFDSRIMTSLGYSQLRDFCKGRSTDLAAALETMKRDTRHYARRQLIWLRRNPKIIWVKSLKQAQSRLRKFLKK